MAGLWDWVLDVYARPAVQEISLKLQDEHGQNVSFLLWAIHERSEDGALLEQAAAISRGWDETTLHPLRAVRRALKTPCPPVADAPREALREDVKAAEVRAERVLLEALEGLGGRGPDRAAPLVAVGAAVRAWGRPAPVETLAALTDAVA